MEDLDLGSKFINMDTNVNKGWRKQENIYACA